MAGTGKGPTERQVVLGQRIASRRQSMGVSQDRFALDAGLHRTYITSLERGLRNPSLETLCKIATALECDVAELTTGLQDHQGRPN